MRLYSLLVVMVVMAGALFAANEALAMVLTGTPGEDTLVGTDRYDRLTGLTGEDSLKGRGGADNRPNWRLPGPASSWSFCAHSAYARLGVPNRPRAASPLAPTAASVVTGRMAPHPATRLATRSRRQRPKPVSACGPW